jgi:hypothetical protein
MCREGNSLGMTDDKLLGNVFGPKKRVRKNKFFPLLIPAMNKVYDDSLRYHL